ncbi:MAG: peptidylprolyl isomerase [Betaproteobacteria bacterium]|jgi:FKBP-type peptidyl-prolyl cis-trans isomerase SlpA
MENTVKIDSFLTLHYRLSFKDGADIANTFTDKPATVLIGAGQFAPGLENALMGMINGEHKTVTLSPEQGFGLRNPELVQKISLETLKQNSNPEEDYSVGDMVEFDAPHGGKYAGTLQSIDESGAWFDFNHPLAGKEMIFEVKIISIL